ncbi:hypothetical protein [Chitinophaga sp. Cy-1792]|uniref:hypothetical protein n=1 Tax=Chitinophaga sp. Cy-1792 TaxID=2608339 RepID=UPI00141F5F04|nr:hypothetical protein [Chitinophaga sp. Cy-1792]NIG55117.1 hypothetical protein [Chitinophaga sp. Cy-1792]
MKKLKQQPWLILFVPIVIMIMTGLFWGSNPHDYFYKYDFGLFSITQGMALGAVALAVLIVVYHYCHSWLFSNLLTWVHVILCFICAGLYFTLYFLLARLLQNAYPQLTKAERLSYTVMGMDLTESLTRLFVLLQLLFFVNICLYYWKKNRQTKKMNLSTQAEV